MATRIIFVYSSSEIQSTQEFSEKIARNIIRDVYLLFRALRYLLEQPGFVLFKEEYLQEYSAYFRHLVSFSVTSEEEYKKYPVQSAGTVINFLAFSYLLMEWLLDKIPDSQ